MGGMGTDPGSGRVSVVERHVPEGEQQVRGEGRPLFRIWALATAIFFCFCAAWSLATPIGAANDEPAQLVKAASVVRGEIVGHKVSPKLLAQVPAGDRADFEGCLYLSTAQRCSAADTVVTVPGSFADFSRPLCFTLFSQAPAGCDQGLRGPGREVKATTYVGRYPPLYYAIVGLPSLASHTDTGVYLMRLLSGLASAVFLGLAFALAAFWSRSRLMVAAVAVAASAMVVIFSSVVNPSGLECASAICVWTGGLILVIDQADHPRPSVVIITAVAASVMVLMRGLSPLWLVVIAVFLIALAPRSISPLFRWRRVRVAVGAIAVAGVVAVGYILWAHALSVYPIGTPVAAGTSELGVVQSALGRTATVIKELAGAFGWTETSPPLAVTVVWLLSASVLAVAGLCTSLRRHAAVIVGLLLASVVVPTALMVSQAHKNGLVWQARDGFPLYVGIFLVAGAVAFRNREPTAVDGEGAPAESRMAHRLVLLLAICRARSAAR